MDINESIWGDAGTSYIKLLALPEQRRRFKWYYALPTSEKKKSDVDKTSANGQIVATHDLSVGVHFRTEHSDTWQLLVLNAYLTWYGHGVILIYDAETTQLTS